MDAQFLTKTVDVFGVLDLRDLKDIDMCGGALWGLQMSPRRLDSDRFHCGDPWVDENGREWMTLEICHLLRQLLGSLKVLKCIK